MQKKNKVISPMYSLPQEKKGLFFMMDWKYAVISFYLISGNYSKV